MDAGSRQESAAKTDEFPAPKGFPMSKQAEFAVILKMNPMFADLGTDELQRISNLCRTQQLGLG